ncbi:hypothetical protein K461DRAFT_271669 [Myriangium duriaei CBS 260.36]|uniref:Rhodopsin domain-containing protein n=1 Tax=Myriangium duriaei CBS 260.36 TaxID=1168546 RepID=A0A9P4IYJ9_9PEZI|nr:hypothetical protein K461DRAFT_271669 [Myriangium duriaei CBS 260.36]
MVNQFQAQFDALHVHPMRLILTPAILLPLVLITASLRFYVRGRMMRAFAWDDWALLLAVIIETIDSAIYITASVKQLDHGIVAEQNLLARIIIAGETLYLAGQMFLKASMGLYFLRVVNKKWQKLTIQILLGVYESFTFAYLICAVFAYGLPTPKNILLQSAAPHAMNRNRFKYLNYTYAIINVIVDVVFTALPILVVYSAMMSARAKLSVSFLILLGAVGSVVSIVRIYYLPAITGAYTFGGIEMLGVISLAETAAGIIAISLAAIRPLLKALFEKTSYYKGNTASKSMTAINGVATGISKRTEIVTKQESAEAADIEHEAPKGITDVKVLEV